MRCALIALGPESGLVLAVLTDLPATHVGLCLLSLSPSPFLAHLAPQA